MGIETEKILNLYITYIQQLEKNKYIYSSIPEFQEFCGKLGGMKFFVGGFALRDFAPAEEDERCQTLWKPKKLLEYWNIGINSRNYMILKGKVGSR